MPTRIFSIFPAVELALYPDRMGAFLQKAGLIERADAFRLCNDLDGESNEPVTCFVGVPIGRVEQMLHTIRSGASNDRSQLPAVLTFSCREPFAQVLMRMKRGEGIGPDVEFFRSYGGISAVLKKR